MSATTIIDTAPLGALIRYTDGSPKAACTLHQKAGSLGKVQRCWPSGEEGTAAALSDLDGSGVLHAA
jgi:hypothetical protein